MVRLRHFAIAVAVLLNGCSLILDNDSLLGDAGADLPDGSRPDGGPDAGEDAPSAPVVSITPDPARTADTLSAQIDTDSVDLLGAGIDRYEYTWLRDGSPSGDTGTDVDAASTTKGEMWTVEVVGVTADDRRSPPGTASVTIANTPPELLTVGLSHYRPVEGDLLEALPGTVEDPDPDSISVRFEWYVNGSLVAGESNRRLQLTPSVAPAGSTIEVRVHATDGTEEVGPVAGGEALVVTNERRWHRLLPDRSNVFFSTLDVPNDRVFAVSRFQDGGQETFEYDLENDRVVGLEPTDPFPSLGLPPARAGQSLFLIDRSGTAELEVLEYDLSSRGREAVTTLALTQSTSSSSIDAVLGYVFDSRGNRLLVGIRDLSSATHILAVDLASSPHAVSDVAMDVAPIPSSAGWVVHESMNVVVLVGGETDAGTPLDEVRILPLDDPSSIATSSIRLPEPVVFPIVGYSPTTEHVLYGYGIDSIMTGGGYETLYRVDVSSQDVDAIDVSGTPGRGLLGWILPDRQGRLLMSRDQNERPLRGGDFEVIEIDTTSWTTRYLHQTGSDLPGQLDAGTMWFEAGEAYLWGGQTRSDTASAVSWQLQLPTDRRIGTIREISLTADPGAGAPDPVFGQALSSDPGPYVWGGSTGASLVGGTAWRADGTDWNAQPLTSATMPPSRSGSIITRGCGFGIGVFGGDAGSGPTNDLWVMSCTARDFDCAWTNPAIGGVTPSPRVDAAAYQAFGGTVIVGGRNGGLIHDPFQFDACSPVAATVTLAGAVPTPRAGHAIVGDLYYGGADASGPRDDSYLLSFDVGSRTLTFTELVEPSDSPGRPRPRSHVQITEDPTQGRVFLYGGRGATFPGLGRFGYSDLWELRGLP